MRGAAVALLVCSGLVQAQQPCYGAISCALAGAAAGMAQGQAAEAQKPQDGDLRQGPF